QDGRSSGLTAPNGPAQQAVIRKALANAGLSPEDINYLEAHGTGTPLGDPIEVQALASVLAAKRSPDNPLILGSVKANIGHLEAAAGITGFIKLALSLHHNEMPPQIHFKSLNPNIQIDGMPIKISTELAPWPSTPRRLGGVSSFGFSGTNAHVILEAAPQRERDNPHTERSAHVLTLSARTRPALLELAKKFSAHLEHAGTASLPDICWSANIGRATFDHRLAVVGNSHAQLRERLDVVAQGNAEGVRMSTANATNAPRVAFMFTGQGCQYRKMGRILYETQEVFRDAMDRCAGIIDAMLTVPLLETLYDERTPLSIDNTLYAQPCIFAVEYSLAELWKSWGILPAVVMGHSLGEYAAATLAGAVTLEGALTLVAARARLSATLTPEGEMAATMAGPDKLNEVLGSLMQGDICVAAYNGPESTVISGKYAPMKEALERLGRAAIRTQVLAISNSFHSPSVEPILPDFVAAAATIAFSPTRLPLVSNLTGAIADEAVIGNPEYWGRHLREPVQFHKSLQVLREQGVTHFIEVGPKPTLLNMGRKCLPEYGELAWLPSLKPDRDDWDQMLESLGALFVAGHAVDWTALECGHTRYRVPLPTYAFQRQRHALEPLKAPQVAAAPGAASATDVVAETSRAAARGILGARIDTTTEQRLVEALCAGYIAHALKGLEAFAGGHKTLTAEEVLTRGRVLPQHRALVLRWLPQLVAHGFLREQGGRYSDLKAPTKTAMRAALQDARDTWKKAPSLIGWATNPLDFIQRCGERLGAVLRGGDPLEALFGEDYFGTAASFYETSEDARQHNALAAEVLQAYVRGCSADKHFNVLEIGAGSGGLTSAVIPALPAGRTSYVFTDTSSAFFTRANARFSKQTLLACATLDISRDPEAQGFPRATFDVVVASNVLHATPNLQETLRRARALLKPDGVILFNEVTSPSLWYDLLFGPLLPAIEGDPLRTTEHLLTPAAWRQALEAEGFRRVSVLPQDVAAPGDPRASGVWWSILFAQSADRAADIRDASAAEAPTAPVPGAPASERAAEIRRLVASLKGTAGTDPSRLQLMSEYLQHL
ncbi:MAG TPA: acyltransferase domain-containing protein, partial [Myxococcota bacterium]|nr:acyltransferase domain-containing protein [Myxococcota bacterium]